MYDDKGNLDFVLTPEDIAKIRARSAVKMGASPEAAMGAISQTPGEGMKPDLAPVVAGSAAELESMFSFSDGVEATKLNPRAVATPEELRQLVDESLTPAERFLGHVYVPAQALTSGLAEGVAAIPEAIGQVQEMTGLGTGETMRGTGAAIRAPFEFDPRMTSSGLPVVESPSALGVGLDDIAGGLGSATAFVAGGAGARALGLSAKAGAGLLGATMEAQSLYREAEAAGADDATKMAAFAFGAGIGASEMAGVGSLLDRIDKRSGGQVKSALLRTVSAAGREGVEEGVQEAGQTFSELMVAQQILKYAEPQEAEEIIRLTGQAGLIGSIIGVGLGSAGELQGESATGALLERARAAGLPSLKPKGGEAKADPAQAAAGEEVLASAAEAKVEAPKEAKTGEQAAETLKKANNVPDAVVRMAGEVTGVDPEVEISEGEEALGGLLTLLRQARPDPSTVPDIALVDAGQELQAKGVAEGGAIAIDATRAADAMRSTLMHEVQHLSAAPGTEAFGEIVARARTEFPGLAKAKMDRYVENFKEEFGHEPFRALPEGPRRDAALADEGFAQGAEDFTPLVEKMLLDPSLASAMSVNEARTIRDWVVAVLNKIPGLNLETSAGKKRRKLVDELIDRKLQDKATPEEIIAFADAIRQVMESPSPQEFKKAAEVVTVEDVLLLTEGAKADTRFPGQGTDELGSMREEKPVKKSEEPFRKEPEAPRKKAEGATTSPKTVEPTVADKWDSIDGPREVVGTRKLGDREMVEIQTEGRSTRELVEVKDLEQEKALDADRLKGRKRAADHEKAADAESKAREFKDDGFTDGMPQIKAARIKKSLERSVSIKGALGRRGDLIRDLVNAGYRVQDVGGERRFVSPSGSFFLQKDLTKIGLDFAEFLSGLESPASDPLFSIAPREDSAAFKRWFKQSAAANRDGSPKLYSHGTISPDEITEFLPLTHFGEPQQSNVHATGGGLNPPGGRNIPVYLSIQNPFRIVDTLWNDAEHQLEQVWNAGLLAGTDRTGLTEDEIEDLDMMEDPMEMALEGETAAELVIRSLELHGYDGMVYTDEKDVERVSEGTPWTDAYIPLRASQVKSVSNRGAWDGDDSRPLFSVAGKGRVPALTEAASRLQAGGAVTRSEYRTLVDRHKPVRPYGFVPAPASREEMRRALGKKADKIGAGASIPEGARVGLRLDIPAYTRHGVWVPTIHVGKGAAKVIGYESVASVTNAEFRMSEKTALKIAAGKSKDPFAMIRGDWKPRTVSETRKLANEALGSPDWIQVGMDPERHGYFYDRVTHGLVKSAEEVIQVGPLVLARNPTMGDTASARFSVDAYHGSPHDVDEFTTEKVGTGEGAQAFGWGLYFATKKSVADWYKKVLSHQGEGFGYRVRLAPADDEYLLWDAPLDEQTDVVREALEVSAGALAPGASLEDSADWSAWDNGPRGWEVVDGEGDTVALVTRSEASTASGAIDVAESRVRSGEMPVRTGEDIYKDLAREMGPKAASEELLAAGIRGVKYLDADSRHGIQGTHNYVIFDEADVEIEARFSVEGGDQDPDIEKTIQYDGLTKFQNARRYWQDYFLPVRKAQEGIGAVPESQDVSLAETLYPGVTQDRIEKVRDMARDELEGVIGEEISFDEAHKFLWALHASERNEYIRDKDLRDNGGKGKWNTEYKPGSGMRSSEARKVVNEALKGPNGARYRRLRRFNRKLQRKRLATLRDAGLLTPEFMAAIQEQGYTDYVPLIHTMQGKPSIKQGKGFQSSGSGIKKAGGRTSEADNTLVMSLAKAEEAIVRAEKAKVDLALYNLAKANPDPDFWSIHDAPVSVESDQSGVLKQLWDMREDWRDMSVPVMVDGKQKVVVFNKKGEDLARALKQTGIDGAGPVLKKMRVVTRYLSAINTSWNPEFILTNFVRDLQTAGVVLTEAEQMKVALTVTKQALPAIRGIHRTEGGKESEWSSWWDRLKAAGGKTGFYHAKSLDEVQADLQKDLAELAPSTSARESARRYGNGVVKFVEGWNGAVENGVRLAAFKYAVEVKGLTDAKAAELAKNLTVNFNRKGEANWFSSLYMFANASIQGSTRVAATILKSKRGRKIGAGLVLGGAILDALNYMLSPDDDDGENAWDAVPEWRKDRYLMLADGNGGFFSIPMPYGFNVFGSMGRNLLSLARGGSSPLEATGNIASSVVGSFSPVGDFHNMSMPSLLRFASPTIMDPLVEIATNENYRGSPIAPTDSPYDRVQKPSSQRAWRSTPEPYMEAAAMLNSLTGGNEFESGVLDVSPDALQYLMGVVGGGLLRFGERTLNTARRVPDEGIAALHSAPFVRQVHQTESERKGFTTYRENAVEIELLSRMVRGYKDLGEPEKAAEIQRENRDLLRLESRLKALDKRKRRAQELIDTEKDETKKQELTDNLYADIRAFNRKVSEARESQ